MPKLKSGYRFPLNFTRDYLNPRHYAAFGQACYERMKKGVSREDEFSLDYYLMRILLESLPKYKDDGEYGEFVIFTTSNPLDHDDNDPGVDEWSAMIDAIWSSIYDIYGDHDDLDLSYSTEAQERFTLAMHVFADHVRGLWW